MVLRTKVNKNFKPFSMGKLTDYKYLVYNSTVKSTRTITYGTETWKFNKHLESTLMSVEVDFLRKSVRCSRLTKLEIMLLEKNI